MATASVAAGVISLIDKMERTENVGVLKAKMRSCNIDVLTWPATTPDALPRILLDYQSFNSAVAMACLCSHLSLICHLWKTGADYGIIFEDDVALHADIDFGALIKSAPADWQILSLGTNNPDYFKYYDLMEKHGSPAWLAWNKFYWGAHAYIIKRETMQALNERFWKIPDTLDLRALHDPLFLVADVLIYRLATTYVSRFPWAAQIGNMTSTIQVGKVSAEWNADVVNAGYERIKKIWAAAANRA